MPVVSHVAAGFGEFGESTMESREGHNFILSPHPIMLYV